MGWFIKDTIARMQRSVLLSGNLPPYKRNLRIKSRVRLYHPIKHQEMLIQHSKQIAIIWIPIGQHILLHQKDISLIKRDMDCMEYFPPLHFIIGWHWLLYKESTMTYFLKYKDNGISGLINGWKLLRHLTDFLRSRGAAPSLVAVQPSSCPPSHFCSFERWSRYRCITRQHSNKWMKDDGWIRYIDGWMHLGSRFAPSPATRFTLPRVRSLFVATAGKDKWHGYNVWLLLIFIIL